MANNRSYLGQTTDSLDITWNQIRNKPEEFKPEKHTHEQEDINGLVEFVEETTEFIKLSSKDIEQLKADVSNKVDLEEGKGLSTNDFTHEYKAKIDKLVQQGGSGEGGTPEGDYVISVNGKTGEVNLFKEDIGLGEVLNIKQASDDEFQSFKQEMSNILDKKVDKKAGYQLSQEDFTTELKEKLEGLDGSSGSGEAPVKSVNGKVGEVVLNQEDIGLPNVINEKQATEQQLNDAVSKVETDITKLEDSLDNKVDKDGNKVLSDENFTTELKEKLEGLSGGEEGGSGDVASVNGKTGIVVLDKTDIGLPNVDNVQQATKVEFDEHVDSDIHLTNEDREKLTKLDTVDSKLTGMEDSIANKVDKEDGKGLSSNDFTNDDKVKYDGYDASIKENKESIDTHIADTDKHVTANDRENLEKLDVVDNKLTELENSIKNKVDSEEGKQLSTNDYSNEDKEKVAKVDTIESDLQLHKEDKDSHITVEDRKALDGLVELPKYIEDTTTFKDEVKANEDVAASTVALHNTVVISEGDDISSIPDGTIVFKRVDTDGE